MKFEETNNLLFYVYSYGQFTYMVNRYVTCTVYLNIMIDVPNLIKA